MVKKIKKSKKKDEVCFNKKDCSGSMFYCIGFIGAAIYFIQNATSFWIGVLGVLKAIVWPAFIVYEALNSLGA